ncbi:complex I intermediate-associated protein 30, mitochondrial [Mizuhopecten yessoensis]|uniref:Complex I intermediate-associated protein 30, mitochondrial n=1 Tax=Mizuhopecten yessoensis TaxID=6573 RepID=A0A210PM89_MIZYE|nr:complex I intermediate-associated protein 30, mitochondrial [Mizuhopecten yessoensis]
MQLCEIQDCNIMSALKVAKSCRPFLRPKYQPLVIQTATSVNLFDVDKKGGYRNDLTDNSRKHIIDTAKSWRGELKKFRNELKDILHLRHLDRWNQGHGTYDYLWKFGGQQSIENWTLTADRDNLEGKSSANLTVSKDNNALFHGYLCQEVPQDGVSKSAGYCNIRSPSNYISFRRKQVIEDIGCYTHLVMRVRGDGRPYFINLMMKRTFDITWADQYNYNLYTRGGPYWQTAKRGTLLVNSKGKYTLYTRGGPYWQTAKVTTLYTRGGPYWQTAKRETLLTNSKGNYPLCSRGGPYWQTAKVTTLYIQEGDPTDKQKRSIKARQWSD